MNTNDQTVFGGMPTENEENPQVMNENKKNVPWKFVGLGAATGVLMGAGALFANEAMASETHDSQDVQPTEPVETEQEANAEMPVAKVDPSDSFEHAFEEARAQVGPGGVFHWHGGIYNTYTQEEWNAMSDADKHAFAAKVQPEYGVERINTTHITEKEPQIHIYTEKVMINEPEPTDDDVHYLGTDEISLNGNDISIQNYEVNGHKAAVVNYHDENEHDIAWVDKNDNLKVDDLEAVDLKTGDYLDANLNPMNASDNLLTSADESDASVADLAVDI